MSRTVINRLKQVIAMVLSIMMVWTMIPELSTATSVYAAETSTAGWTELTTAHTNQWIGSDGKTSYYYVKSNTTLTATTAGYSGVGIKGTVYIYVPYGVTLNLNGAAGSGKTGGGPGIWLPKGSTLYLIGGGTVNAKGGAAANGAKGDNGAAGNMNVTDGTYKSAGLTHHYNYTDSIAPGNGGNGGAGGGGGGAGIGTVGGTGGDGGVKGTASTTSLSTYVNGNPGYDGKQGAQGAAIGTLYKASTLTLNPVGGAAGDGGSKGNGGESALYHGRLQNKERTWDNNVYFAAGGGGGGGGGGAGGKGADIGCGGNGGSGGGGGGSGGYWNYTETYTNLPGFGGAAGKGGKGNGKNGGNGTAGDPGTYTDYAGSDNNRGAGGTSPDSANFGGTKTASSGKLEYTITYKYPDGTSTNNTKYVVSSDTKVKLPKDARVKGWKLDTWGKSCGPNTSDFAKQNTSQYDSDSEITLKDVYGDLTFTAVPAEYTVTLDAQGGSGGTGSMTATYYEAMPTSGLVMPTKPGYTCTGFYDSISGGKQYYNGDGSSVNIWDKTEDTTLYAHWTANKYQIEYWSQDDRPVAKDDAAFVEGELEVTYGSFTLKSAAELNLTRTHYDFIGWNIYQDQDWAMYQPGKIYSGGLSAESGGTIVVYAAWKEKPKFTITYSANGGAGAPASETIYRDDDCTVSNTVPTRDGYTFTGWKLDDVTYNAGRKIENVQSNITLTAQWQRNNSVSYHPNGGSYAVAPTSVYPAKHANVDIDFDKKPTREGYIFKGYASTADATDATYTEAGTKKFAMGDNSVTLYAVWEAESYDIDFSGCNGRYEFEGDKPTTVKRDADYSFKLKVTDSFDTENLVVSVNGIALQPSNVTDSDSYKVFTYTVRKATANQSVLIKGIASTPHKISYVLNGGSIVGEYPSYYETGIEAELPTDVQRTGYTFDGWYEDENCKTEPVTTIATSSTDSKTYYAKWNANKYTIEYDANGGSDAPRSTVTSYDSVVNLAAQESMSNKGYGFLGWDTNNNAIFPTYRAGDAVKNLTATANGIVKLYAIWDEEHYTVTYHINGGVMQNTFELIQTVKHGGTITTPAENALTKTGNSFMGWATSEGSANVKYGYNAPINDINANMDLYAVWQAGTYTITYYNGDTKVDGPVDMTFGTAKEIKGGTGLAAPEGKEFLGWSRNKSANAAEYIGGQKVTAIGDGSVIEINLYAVWGDKTAKYLTYNANGGLWKGSVPDSTVDYGDGSVTLANYDSNNLSRPGYTRDGWMIGGKKHADGETITITGNTNAFANWINNTYTVKFDANGGKGVTASQNVVYDEESVLNTNGFTREGYTFKGWARSKNGTIEFIDDQKILNLTNENGAEITLYAVWEAVEPYWITYNANGGMKAPEPSSFAKNSEATVTEAKPELEGYSFEKWNTKADGTGTDYKSGAKFSIANDITLYAVWQKKAVYHVVYDLDGGYGLITDPNSYYVGDTVKVRIDKLPTKPGNTFSGWKIEGKNTVYKSGGTTEFELSAEMANASKEIVLKAQWTKAKYKLTFNFGTSDFIYDGKQKSVAVSAFDNDGRVFSGYKLYYAGKGDTIYSKTTTAPTDAGTYTVTAEGYDSNNYELAEAATASATLTIDKANAVVWANGDTVYQFSDADKTIKTKSAPALGLKVTYYSITNENKVGSTVTPSAVGEYLYVITLDNSKDENKNYQIGGALNTTSLSGKSLNALSGSNYGIMTITESVQPALSVGNSEYKKTYGDAAFTPDVTGGVSGKKLTYRNVAASEKTIAEINTTTGEITIHKPGTAVFEVKSEATGYEDATVRFSVVVQKKPINVTVADKTIKYNDANPYNLSDLTFPSGFDTTGITPIFKTLYSQGDSVGKYSVSVTLPESELYSYNCEPGVLTVDPKVLNASDFDIQAANKVYDGNAVAVVTATVKSTSIHTGDNLSATVTGSFEDETVGVNKTVNYVITGISGNHARNYVLGSTRTGEVKANITNMPITFTFGNTSFTYDGTEKNVDVTAIDENKKVFKDYKVYYTGTSGTTYTKSETAPTDVGTYKVTAEFTNNNTSSESGNNTTQMTIAPANVVVWANGGTEHSYEDANKKISPKSTPDLDLKVTYYNITDENKVGSIVTPSAIGKYLYVITLDNSKDENKNYQIGGALDTASISGKSIDSLEGSNFGIMTIAKDIQPALTVEQSVYNCTFGDIPLSPVITGGAKEATKTYSIVSSTVEECVSVDTSGNVTINKPGTAVIKVTATKEGYADANAQYTVVVAKKPVSVTVNPETITYGQASPYVDGSVDKLSFSDNSARTGSNPTFKTLYASGDQVGKYDVSVTLSDSEKYSYNYTPGTLIVNQKLLKLDDFTVTASDKVYDGTDAASLTANAKSSSLIGSDTLKVSVEGKFVDANAADSKTVNFTITGITGTRAENYVLDNPITGTTTAKINKMPITFQVGKTSFIYDGNSKPVTVTAEDANGKNFTAFTVKYSGNTTAPSAVGNYPITITLNDPTNYKVSDTSDDITGKTLSITKSDIVFTFGNANFTYDGSKKSVSVSAIDDDNRVFTDYKVYYVGIDGTSYAKSETAPTKVGKYKVTAEFTSSKYSCEAGNNTTTLTIKPGNVVVWANSGTQHLYTDTDKTIKAMSVPDLNLDVTYYTISDNGNVGNVIAKPNNRGKYLYVITLKNDSTNKNYVIDGALNISPITKKADLLKYSNVGIMTIDDSVQPELTVNDYVITKTYGDGKFTPRVSGGAPGAKITYSIPNAAERNYASVNETTGEITIKKPGIVVVEATAKADNYEDISVRYTVVINKKVVDIELDDSIEYTGKTEVTPYKVTGDIAGNRVETEDINFVYQKIDDTEVGIFHDAGKYYVTAEIPSSNEYYCTNGAASGIVAITKAPLTLTADDKTAIYGDAEPTYTFTATGLLNKDIVASLGGTAKYACDYKQFSDAGEYAIKLSGVTSNNYDITFVDGKLTVNPLAVVLSWAGDTFTYDGEQHSMIATVANAVNGDKVKINAYTEGKATEVGNHEAVATSLDDNNYTLAGGSNLSKTWSITKKTVTVKPARVLANVNGKATLSLDVTTLLEGDREFTGTPEFIISKADGSEVELADALKTSGTYTISWSNPDKIKFNRNYSVIKNTSGQLIVTAPKTPVEVVKAATSGSKKVKLTWIKVSGATKYVVYGQLCGKKYKKITTTSKNTYTVKKIGGKKLKAHKYYKFYVVAYTAKGQVKSKEIHFITGKTKGKYANAKSIKVNYSAVTLQPGKTITLKPTTKIYKSKKHINKSHGSATRYVSDNPTVAIVNASGVVTAKMGGSATIYVQDAGGLWCTTTVNVPY